jgi:hypothetical protein
LIATKVHRSDIHQGVDVVCVLPHILIICGDLLIDDESWPLVVCKRWGQNEQQPKELRCGFHLE